MERTDRKYFTGFLRFVVSVLIALPLLATAASARAGSGALLRDGVVVDAGRGLAYVMAPAGGIAAVELATGEVVWSTDVADRPLALVDGMLVAQADGVPGRGLPLATVDPADGALQARAELILPANTHNRIDDGIHRSMRVSAIPAAGGAAIAWKAVQAPMQGYFPGSDHEAGAAAKASHLRVDEGMARFDPATGAATAVPAKSVRLEVASLVELGAGEGVPGAGGRQLLSIDGRHVLVTERHGRPAPAALFRWTIYERASGHLLGGFDYGIAAAPFLVHGDRLIVESRPTLFARAAGQEPWQRTSLELRAIDLQRGVPVWKAELRDPTFEGPFPP